MHLFKYVKIENLKTGESSRPRLTSPHNRCCSFIYLPALAVVGARRIDALVLAARLVFRALVDILAMALHGGLRVAVVTHALVSPHQVLTGAVAANTC